MPEQQAVDQEELKRLEDDKNRKKVQRLMALKSFDPELYKPGPVVEVVVAFRELAGKVFDALPEGRAREAVFQRLIDAKNRAVDGLP